MLARRETRKEALDEGGRRHRGVHHGLEGQQGRQSFQVSGGAEPRDLRLHLGRQVVRLLPRVERERLVLERVVLGQDRVPGQLAKSQDMTESLLPHGERGELGDPDLRGDEHHSLGGGKRSVCQRRERIVDRKGTAVRVAHDVEGAITGPIAQVVHREAHGGRHVLPPHVDESGRGRAVAGDAEAQDPGACGMQALAETPHAVGRVGHAVQQQHPDTRIRDGPLEAAIPVAGPTPRIRQAAAAIALDLASGVGLERGIDPFVELREQPLFETEVVLESRNRRPGGELRVELGRVPHREIGPAFEVDDESDDDHEEGADEPMRDREDAVLDRSDEEPLHAESPPLARVPTRLC